MQKKYPPAALEAVVCDAREDSLDISRYLILAAPHGDRLFRFAER